MKVREAFLGIIGFLLSSAVVGQCPFPAVSAPDEVCLGEEVRLEIDEGFAAEWDFCSGELEEIPLPETIVDNSRSFGRTRGMKVIGNSQDGYYMFAVSNTIDELIILSFGNSLFNDPLVVQQINLSSHSPEAFDVDVIKAGDMYYAYIACSSNNTVTRLDFGDSPFNLPQANTLNVEFDAQVHAITLITEGSSIFGFVSQTDKVSRLSFGPDPVNMQPVKTDVALPGVGVMRKSAFYNYCGNWQGLVLPYTESYPYAISFAAGSPGNTMTISPISNNGDDLQVPANLTISHEGDSIYIHVMSAVGNIYVSAQAAEAGISATNFTNMGRLGLSSGNFPLAIVKEGPLWTGFSTDHGSRDLIRYRFPSVCDADQKIRSGNQVEGVYSTPGPKLISVAINDNGNMKKSFVEVNVGNDIAPPVNLTIEASCVSFPADFTFTEDVTGISSVSWDFGDGQSATGVSVEHQYSNPGEYEVLLTVTSTNGCSNTRRQLVTIYPEIIASFTSAGGLQCTNSPVVFINELGPELDEVAQHEWFINGEFVAATKDLTYLFEAPGVYDVELLSRLSDCVSTATNQVTILEGPAPSFTVSDACVGTSLEFTNTSTGQISSYSWDFGDGTTSTVESPVYTYSAPGDYLVRLTTNNASGCETSFEQLLTVHSEPIASFSAELACTGLPIQFNDESTVNNANIEAWFWDFGNGITSIEENPVAQFETAGEQTVSLTVTSTFGCQSSINQTIDVQPSPSAAFTYSTVCLEETVEFTDESVPPEGENIVEWSWDIGGAFSNQRNPTYSFDFPSNFDVSLTVLASNQCVGIYEETIRVPQPPQIDFTFQENCLGSDVLFTDQSTANEDPIVAWQWDFGGLGAGSGEEVSFQFPRAGRYTVTLSVQTENGCSYSAAKQVTIFEAPVAGFEADPAAGAPPLNVNFTNTSQGAIGYEWYVNGELFSTDMNITYIFNELGLYEVGLIAIGEEGCLDEYVATIAAVEPETDMEAVDLLPIRNNGRITFRFTARNNGNVTVAELPVTLLLDNGVSLNDVVPVNIAPGATSAFLLPFDVTDGNFDFMCAEIGTDIAGFPDTNPDNNSTCFNFTEGQNYSVVFPNPADDQLSFRVYADASEDFRIEVMNSSGQIVETPSAIRGQPGIFNVQLDVSGLSQGVYLLRINDGISSVLHRFVIER